MANNRLKLTQTNVQRLIGDHDGTRKVRHWDTEVPKRFLAITPNGSAAYKLQIVRPDGSKTDAKLIAAFAGVLPELQKGVSSWNSSRVSLGQRSDTRSEFSATGTGRVPGIASAPFQTGFRRRNNVEEAMRIVVGVGYGADSDISGPHTVPRQRKMDEPMISNVRIFHI